MKIHSLLKVCSCALMAHIGVQSAAFAEDNTIYLVDVQRVINECVAGKAARNNVETEIKKSETTVIKMKADLDKMKADLDKQSGLLSSGALEDKKNSIAKAERNLQDTIRSLREEVSAKNNSEISRIISDIDQIIADLAKDGKYPVIMEKDAKWVVYNHPRLDLTDTVIRLMDSKKTGL